MSLKLGQTSQPTSKAPSRFFPPAFDSHPTSPTNTNHPPNPRGHRLQSSAVLLSAVGRGPLGGLGGEQPLGSAARWLEFLWQGTEEGEQRKRNRGTEERTGLTEHPRVCWDNADVPGTQRRRRVQGIRCRRCSARPVDLLVVTGGSFCHPERPVDPCCASRWRPCRSHVLPVVAHAIEGLVSSLCRSQSVALCAALCLP